MSAGRTPTRFRGYPRKNHGRATSAELVNAVLERLAAPDAEGGTEAKLLQAWNAAVGAVFGRSTQVESIKGSTLFVRVESSPLAHELTMLKDQILARLRAHLGYARITDFRTRVGPIRTLDPGDGR